MIRGLTITIFLIMCTGCLGGGSGDQPTSQLLMNGASCDMVGGDVCLEFYENIMESDAESLCSNHSFYYSPTAQYSLNTVTQLTCDTTGAVGRCVTAIGEFYYYSGSEWPNSAVAQSDCLAYLGGYWYSL